MQLAVLVAGQSPTELKTSLGRARDVGFDAVQVWPRYPVDDKAWSAILNELEMLGMRLVALGGYINPLDPDPERRRLALRDLRAAIDRSSDAGAPVVVTWSGTLASGMFDPHPGNGSLEAWRAAVRTFRSVAQWAEEAGVTVAVEPYHGHVASTPERLRGLLDEVDSPRLAAVMDPPNFMTAETLHTVNQAMPRMFEILAGKIALVHAKDIRAARPEDKRFLHGGVVLPEAGAGIMDYPLFVKLLRQYVQADVVVEHVLPETIASAHAYVAKHLEAPHA